LRTIWLEHVGVVEVPMPDISTGDKMPTMPASGQRVANLFDNARKLVSDRQDVGSPSDPQIRTP
jgi:hypothetical protein